MRFRCRRDFVTRRFDCGARAQVRDASLDENQIDRRCRYRSEIEVEERRLACVQHYRHGIRAQRRSERNGECEFRQPGSFHEVAQ